MSEQTYGGHTLAEIKAAAEAASAERKYGSSGLHGLETWARDGCRVERDLAAHIRDLQAIPATVLAMAARIEELERQVTCATADHAAALRLVGDVCQVIGYNGKLMTGELMQYVDELAKGAARYRQLRRGQHWSVIDGIGKSLRADELDATIDAAMEQTKNWEGGMICRKTMEECRTPSMCAPFQGCEAGQPDETAKLRQRIAELERERDTAFAKGKAQGAWDATGPLAEAADQYMLHGWQAAREMAAKVCDVDKELSRNSLVRSGIAISAAHIRAMQPPAEWQCAEVSRVCGAAPNTEWAHPDGFGGGLTERRIDDGEGEESKKAT